MSFFILLILDKPQQSIIKHCFSLIVLNIFIQNSHYMFLLISLHIIIENVSLDFMYQPICAQQAQRPLQQYQSQQCRSDVSRSGPVHMVLLRSKGAVGHQCHTGKCWEQIQDATNKSWSLIYALSSFLFHRTRVILRTYSWFFAHMLYS